MINLLFKSPAGLFFARPVMGLWVFFNPLIPIKCELHCAIILFNYSSLQIWSIMAGCLARLLLFMRTKIDIFGRSAI